MKRTIMMIFAVASSIAVVAQIAALAYFYLTGVMTAERLWEIQAVFEEEKSLNPADEPVENLKQEFSIEELMRERVIRTFNLEDREREVDRFAQMIVERRDALLREKQMLEAGKTLFAEELKQLKDREVSEATQLAQGVLLALPPGEAVQELMQLPLDQNVTLLKGMPVKSIGKILKEFNQGDDEQKKRGVEIFEALAHGDPSVRFIADQIKQVQ